MGIVTVVVVPEVVVVVVSVVNVELVVAVVVEAVVDVAVTLVVVTVVHAPVSTYESVSSANVVFASELYILQLGTLNENITQPVKPSHWAPHASMDKAPIPPIKFACTPRVAISGPKNLFRMQILGTVKVVEVTVVAVVVVVVVVVVQVPSELHSLQSVIAAEPWPELDPDPSSVSPSSSSMVEAETLQQRPLHNAEAQL